MGAEHATRRLPELTPVNEFFWTAGESGRLRILRCDSCMRWRHPPAPICPDCLSRSLTPQTLSGHGMIEAVTINHQPWGPGAVTPYAIALVSLDECPDVRLTSRLVADGLDNALIGRRVRVVFEHHGDVWLPFFELVAGDDA